MPGQREVLPLTDEYLKNINIKLWKAISDKNLQKLYDSLDQSIKQNVKYDTIKRYIRESLKNFKLNKLKRSKEMEKKLQIRVTPHQFLLNNVLILMDMSFEDLFQKSVLDETSPEVEAGDDDNEPEPEEADIEMVMRNIDKKLDRIIELNTRSKKKSLTERYIEIEEFLSTIPSYFISPYDSPGKNGFSRTANNGSAPTLLITGNKWIQIMDDKDEQSRLTYVTLFIQNFYFANRFIKRNEVSTEEICTYNFQFITYFLSFVHKGSELHSLFHKMQSHSNNDFLFVRLLYPFYILTLFFEFMNKFIERAKDKTKEVFTFSVKDKMAETVPR